MVCPSLGIWGSTEHAYSGGCCSSLHDCHSIVICIHVDGITVQNVKHVLVGNVPELASGGMEGYCRQMMYVYLMNKSLEKRVRFVGRRYPHLEFLDGKNAGLH
jgi:hypothetical protein